MTEYRGGSCSVRWYWSGGNLDLSSAMRNLSLDVALDTLEVTPAETRNRQYLPLANEWSAQYSGVAQNNAQAPQGTLFAQALREGERGVLYIAPFGTVGSALLCYGYALCTGSNITEPYADVASLAARWLFEGMNIISTGPNLAGVAAGQASAHVTLGSQFIVGLGVVGSSYIGT